jgi:alpha-1,6-mannosyltransferase
MAVRITLGALGVLALRSFRVAIGKKFGKEVEMVFTVITCSQFHFIFYLSRTLPNIFALCLVLIGFRFWLQEEWQKTIAIFAFAASVFRSELVILFAPMALEGLLNGRFTIKQALISGSLSSVASIALSVAFDSVLWDRLLWPEGEVFWYNTFLNKSHNWGTSPFHWYFTSALPRALLGSIALIPVGLILDSRVRTIAMVALVFISIYSYLPHKELRFIIYSIPLWNTVSAVGLVRLYHNLRKSRFYQLVTVGAVGLLFLSIIASSGFLYVSVHNYPAGQALNVLHRTQAPGFVHIDTYSAMNGISRFLEEMERSGWRYSKAENISSLQYLAFDYLLIGTEHLDEWKRKVGQNLPFAEISTAIVALTFHVFHHL